MAAYPRIHLAAVNVNDGSADMLSDSSGLSRCDFSFADGVKASWFLP